MTLKPVHFLWKQLNGPQITAIVDALYALLRDMFNPIISYLTTFSINTANDSHLTFIGICSGIIRPIIQVADSRFFLFTRDPEHNQDYGVSDLNNLTLGGVFSDLGEDVLSRRNLLCPALYYRTILQGFAASKGQVGSIALIDDIMGTIWNNLHPDGSVPLAYRIRWFTHRETSVSTCGDIEVLMGPIDSWGNRDTAVMWQGVLTGIFNNMLNPNTYVVCNFNA